MKTTDKKLAVSTAIFAVVTIVLIVVAAAGFGLYATKTASTTTETSTSTAMSISTTTAMSISTTTETMTGSSSGSVMQTLKSGGFLNSATVTFGYSQDYLCTPSLTTFGFNSTEAANAAKDTGCEVGAGNSTAVADALPVFVLVPAYAGLSIFGVGSLGASAQGYPVFDNQTIATQCGAGGTGAACPDHPTYIYSPDFTLVEQHLGIMNGVFGLPEGVLPTPSHDHVVGYNGTQSIPWYMVTVLVFDPNIMPNAVTGQCTQVVKSDLANPTGNCLNSLSAIQAALGTKTAATANANATQNDPIYDTFGGVQTQVLVPGVTAIAETSPANSNLFLYFNVVSQNPYN
jgi:hypothetical protein